MKLPIHFYKPLAVGAPQPIRELPVRPERVIHFFPPHIEKIRARIPDVAKQVDVLCGNLEDAIPMDAKEAARAGFIEVARATDFGDTALWVRVNALNSPWVLDDIAEIVAAVGNKLDVMMIPKVEGPWDIHFVDQYLALLEAKHQIQKPILIHALLETAQGMMNLEAIAGAWSLAPNQIPIAKRVFSPDVNEVLFAKRILDAMPDGSGVAMIDGKMQDDATWKQAKVIVDLARMIAKKDPDLAQAYGL
jgi:citrate lyase beta subunit